MLARVCRKCKKTKHYSDFGRNKETNTIRVICKTSQDVLSKALAVDHDHSTHRIRGLLCPACNTGIGSLKEDISVLGAAIEYLAKF